jgi:hypothetical protein
MRLSAISAHSIAVTPDSSLVPNLKHGILPTRWTLRSQTLLNVALLGVF